MKRGFTVISCVLALSAWGATAGASAADNSDAPEATTASSAQAAATSADFANPQAKRSYALGMDIGNTVKDLPIKIDVDMLTQGVKDAASGSDTRLSAQQQKLTMQEVNRTIQLAQMQQVQKQAKANLDASQAFLDKNKDRDGVKVTDSGLQYKVLEQGDGLKPDANDVVTVHYIGKLIDGTVFDSSRERGEPAQFPVNGVIKGWSEALQLMHEGARYELFIPPKLGYGMRGAGQAIGPNQALIFDVELLKVTPKPD